MTDDINTIIQHSKIGDAQTLSLKNVDENRIASLSLAEQAHYKLDIICRDLDHALYDNDDFYNAVKKLATRSPKAKIRILIQNSDKIVKQGHRLLGLARKLSSYIEIRLQSKRFKEFNEAWLIVDDKAWLRRPLADRYNAELHFSAARQLRDISQQFNDMWYEAEPDPNLRQLSL